MYEGGWYKCRENLVFAEPYDKAKCITTIIVVSNFTPCSPQDSSLFYRIRIETASVAVYFDR